MKCPHCSQQFDGHGACPYCGEVPDTNLNNQDGTTLIMVALAILVGVAVFVAVAVVGA